MSLLKNKLEEIFRETFDDEMISLNDDNEKLGCSLNEYETQEVDDLRKVKDLISLIKEKTPK